MKDPGINRRVSGALSDAAVCLQFANGTEKTEGAGNRRKVFATELATNVNVIQRL